MTTIVSIQGESRECPERDSPDAGITPRGEAILAFIAEHTDAQGYPPSVREICDRVGLASTSSVHHQLRKLERLGLLVRGPRKSRALTVCVHTGHLDEGEAA